MRGTGALRVKAALRRHRSAWWLLSLAFRFAFVDSRSRRLAWRRSRFESAVPARALPRCFRRAERWRSCRADSARPAQLSFCAVGWLGASVAETSVPVEKVNLWVSTGLPDSAQLTVAS